MKEKPLPDWMGLHTIRAKECGKCGGSGKVETPFLDPVSNMCTDTMIEVDCSVCNGKGWVQYVEGYPKKQGETS